ncbi:ABC transporter ATP-binding protein/permease [Modestobacter sp. VKM Ac-2985]|uniref:ABC transporter ATP-binding protein/permease n=1 Tax=Modestobacter sp. VKM Ac-2985 TaxID=3004139 RepID=UPI0022AB6E81|nr:ATP-binding cassette domain-containing protein [Modestobacter sp. VKM Ac-2985]MCZ2839432.1 ATP-binding cassette domain-containing protein [Modestobacter sp. VKM Ac-2985]
MTVTARAALGLLGLLVLAVLAGPLLSPWSPTATDLTAVRAGPSAAHLLGTDHLGRDELTRLLVAGRTSLGIVLLTVAIALPLGLALGLLAGWRGGWVDSLVLRTSDVVVAVPALLVGVVLAGVLGGGAGGLVLALAAGSWASYARLVRMEVLLRRRAPVVQALTLLGARPGRVLGVHLLPAVAGPVLVLAGTDVAGLVLGVSTLSFLGLGVRPPTPEWGAMIVEARPHLATDPRLFLLPMLALALLVLLVLVLARQAQAWTTHGRPAVRAPGHRARPAPAGRPTEALLSVRGLTVELAGPHERRRVVDGVDLDVGRGEVVALVGGSGSGKSLTAAAVLGLLPEAAGAVAGGSVRLAGQELVGATERDLRRVRGARVALVPQDVGTALDPLRRIGPQVAEAARLHRGLDRRAATAVARELLVWAGLPDVDRVLRARPAELSGGMRQRVLVAAALAGGPQLLVADEPTSALDAATAGQVLALLARARDEHGTAVLLISHDLGLVGRHADTVTVLDAGQVVESGPVAQVLDAPAHPVTGALRDAAVEPAAAPAPPPGGAPLLLARDVGVRYPAGRWSRSALPPALTGVSFTLPRGGGLGVVGESGSGKTTLARVLTGLQCPTAGTVELAGSTRAAGTGHAQLVFQDPASALDLRQPVGAALREALLLARRRGRPVPLGGPPALLTRVGLDPELAGRRPWQLSGGQQQRVVIARALAAAPDLIVLDEPVSSLDAVVRAGVLELLRSVRAEGVALVVISHDLAAVAALTDELLVLHHGAVVDRGATPAVLARRRPGPPGRPTPDPARPGRDVAAPPLVEEIHP